MFREGFPFSTMDSISADLLFRQFGVEPEQEAWIREEAEIPCRNRAIKPFSRLQHGSGLILFSH